MPSPRTSAARTWPCRSSGSTRSRGIACSASGCRRRSGRSRKWGACSWARRGRFRRSSTSAIAGRSTCRSGRPTSRSVPSRRTSSGSSCTIGSHRSPGSTAPRSSSSTRAGWWSAWRTRSRSGSERAASRRTTAACRGARGSTPRSVSRPGGSRWWWRRARSSSASTSAASIWCATSARRGPWRRSSSASAAPATRPAPRRRASCIRSPATISCRRRPPSARCAPASSTRSRSRWAHATCSHSSASRSPRPARSASRRSSRSCAARIPSAIWRGPTSTPCSSCSPKGSRRGAGGARRTCTTIA